MAHDVRKAEKNESVPANHAEIKQVGEPQEFPYPENDENSNHLTEQDTASRTEHGCQTSHQGIHFESAEMKCDQRRYQVEHLQHDKARFGSKDVRDFHPFETLEPKFATWNHMHKTILSEIAIFCEVP
jgi:hypothetical protein